MTSNSPWWQGAVVYQVYPRSFLDSNADGVGDLRGITRKMAYIAALGVDALWISPFFKSPMKDFGYDVEDYCAVDPLFGDMADFKALLDAAHSFNLKVILDQVWAHTSDRHAWFLCSRRGGTHKDWYIWADAKKDGTPPNNWLSVFGGPAWTFDAARGQFYLHHFLSSQPALNLWNPEVREAVKEAARFWLKLGVDGFRLDVAHGYLCDPLLRDNPPRPPDMPPPGDMTGENPLSRQHRIFSGQQPENLSWLSELRDACAPYGDIFLMGEIGGDESHKTIVEYVAKDKRLQSAYSFDLLQSALRKEDILRVAGYYNAAMGEEWITYAFSNHDVVRVVSRGDETDSFARYALALGLSLRGCFCLYQGEELGLTEADVPFEDLQDPYGKQFYPKFKGRDGCRTPMPWEEHAPHAGFSTGGKPWLPPYAPHAGFSTGGKPWLPPYAPHREKAVDRQERDAQSLLQFTRKMLRWRGECPALRHGSMDFLDLPGDLIGFTRHLNGEAIYCLFNTGKTPHTWEMPVPARIDENAPQNGCVLSGRSIEFQAYGFLFLIR